MSVNDYIAKMESRNRKLFRADKLQIKVDALKELIRHAFEAGEKAGRESRSVFDQVFGRKN